MAEPSDTDVKTLFAYSANNCYMPGCGEQLTKPGWKQVKGRICHIRAQRPGGPRYDPDYPNVHCYDNLILLCPTCHTTIDDLEPDLWTVERLEELKACHELASQDAYKAKWWEREGVNPERAAALVLAASRLTLDSSRLAGDPDPPDASATLSLTRPSLSDSRVLLDFGPNGLLTLINNTDSDLENVRIRCDGPGRSLVSLGAVRGIQVPAGTRTSVGQIGSEAPDSLGSTYLVVSATVDFGSAEFRFPLGRPPVEGSYQDTYSDRYE